MKNKGVSHPDIIAAHEAKLRAHQKLLQKQLGQKLLALEKINPEIEVPSIDGLMGIDLFGVIWYAFQNEWYPLGAMVGLNYSEDINGGSLSDTIITADSGYLIGYELFNNWTQPVYVIFGGLVGASPTKQIRVPARGGANIAQMNVKYETALTVLCGADPDGTGSVGDVVKINATYR